MKCAVRQVKKHMLSPALSAVDSVMRNPAVQVLWGHDTL